MLGWRVLLNLRLRYVTYTKYTLQYTKNTITNKKYPKYPKYPKYHRYIINHVTIVSSDRSSWHHDIQ